MMKNVSRNKLLLCFRPVTDMEAVLESERHDYIHSPSCDSVNYGSPHNKIGKKAPTSPDSGCSTYSGESEVIPPSKRSLSRSVKDTLFGTVPKRRENQQESTRSKPSSSTDFERRPLICHSDSSPSTLSIETKKDEKTHRVLAPSQRNIQVGCCSNIEDGLCLVLISLVITIWLGRFCAIIFTSVWLYLIPRKTLRDHSTKLAPAVTMKEMKSLITKGDAWKAKQFQFVDEIHFL